MEIQDIQLFSDMVTAFFASVFSLVYYLKWRNGKSWLSLVSFVVFGILTHSHAVVLFNLKINYIRPRDIFYVVCFVVICHVIYDWQRNLENLKIIKRISEEENLQKAQ